MYVKELEETLHDKCWNISGLHGEAKFFIFLKSKSLLLCFVLNCARLHFNTLKKQFQNFYIDIINHKCNFKTSEMFSPRNCKSL